MFHTITETWSTQITAFRSTQQHIPQTHGWRRVTHPRHWAQRTSSSSPSPYRTTSEPTYLSLVWAEATSGWRCQWSSSVEDRCCCRWLPVFVRAGVFTGQWYQRFSRSVRLCGERQAGAGGGRWTEAAQERGAILKGYPPSATLAKGITPCCRLFSISGSNVGSLFL